MFCILGKSVFSTHISSRAETFRTVHSSLRQRAEDTETKSCRGKHGRRPTFGTNELIFTETKIFETKVVPRGILYTIVYYQFKKK